MRKVIPEAVELIKRTEKLAIDADGVCRPYQGGADKKGVITIGYGHVIGANEKHLLSGIYRGQAELLFVADVIEHSKHIQLDVGAKVVLSDWLYGMFASFCFNNGPHALADRIKNGKPYTPTITVLLRAGKPVEAVSRLYEFCNSDGQYRDGLIYRRFTEMYLGLTGVLVKKPDNCKEAYALMTKLTALCPMSDAGAFFARKHVKEKCPTC